MVNKRRDGRVQQMQTLVYQHDESLAVYVRVRDGFYIYLLTPVTPKATALLGLPTPAFWSCIALRNEK